MGYYDSVYCHVCGNEVCSGCGCCQTPWCENCSCPDVEKELLTSDPDSV